MKLQAPRTKNATKRELYRGPTEDDDEENGVVDENWLFEFAFAHPPRENVPARGNFVALPFGLKRESNASEDVQTPPSFVAVRMMRKKQWLKEITPIIANDHCSIINFIPIPIFSVIKRIMNIVRLLLELKGFQTRFYSYLFTDRNTYSLRGFPVALLISSFS